jgi:hypothetical protein
MEAAGSLEMLVQVYQTACTPNPSDHNLRMKNKFSSELI